MQHLVMLFCQNCKRGSISQIQCTISFTDSRSLLSAHCTYPEEFVEFVKCSFNLKDNLYSEYMNLSS